MALTCDFSALAGRLYKLDQAVEVARVDQVLEGTSAGQSRGRRCWCRCGWCLCKTCNDKAVRLLTLTAQGKIL